MSCYLSIYLFVSKEHLDQFPSEDIIKDKAIYLNSFSRNTALYEAAQEAGMPYDTYFDLGSRVPAILDELEMRIAEQKNLIADVDKFMSGNPSWEDFCSASEKRKEIQEVLDANKDAYATLKVFQDILIERKYTDDTTYLVGLDG